MRLGSGCVHVQVGQDLCLDQLEDWGATVRRRFISGTERTTGRETARIEGLKLRSYRTYISMALHSSGYGVNVISSLPEPQLTNIWRTLKAVISCAVGRADVVGRFFDHLTTSVTPEESRKIFLRMREAITIAFPFLGMPTCIPGCYGMIGVVERKGQQYGETKVLRKPVIDDDDVRKGRELRTRIYSGVGNSEIFGLMDKYFTDLCEIVPHNHLMVPQSDQNQC